MALKSWMDPAGCAVAVKDTAGMGRYAEARQCKAKPRWRHLAHDGRVLGCYCVQHARQMGLLRADTLLRVEEV